MSKFRNYALAGAFGLAFIASAMQISFNDGKATPSVPKAIASADEIEQAIPEPVQQQSTTIADHQVAACKAAIALMNDRDVATFSGRSLDANTVHVEWRRPDDGKIWQARCRPVGDDGLRWAAFNAFGDGQQGRWRDEDTIEAKIEGDRLYVTLRQLGLSEKRADYNLTDLG